jgi:hypothetical protein
MHLRKKTVSQDTLPVVLRHVMLTLANLPAAYIAKEGSNPLPDT